MNNESNLVKVLLKKNMPKVKRAHKLSGSSVLYWLRSQALIRRDNF